MAPFWGEVIKTVRMPARPPACLPAGVASEAVWCFEALQTAQVERARLPPVGSIAPPAAPLSCLPLQALAAEDTSWHSTLTFAALLSAVNACRQ